MHLSSLAVISVAVLATSVAAAPVPEPSMELEPRILSFIGKALRGAPKKAGKQVGKEQGQGGVSSKTVDNMTKNMGKYLGKEQDRKCVEGLANTLYRNGGANMIISCDKKKDTKSIGARASDARAKAFAMAKKKGLMRRQFGEWDLEELD